MPLHLRSRVALALVLSTGIVACKKQGGSDSPGQIDCDTEIQYQSRKVEANVNVGKFGASVDTSVAAVREIDGVVERYMARWKAVCREYNAGVYDKETYRAETKELRQRMEDLDALLIRLSNAPDPESYKLALRELYTKVVPEQERKDLALEFGMLAKAPGEAQARPVTQGTQLRTGTKVTFTFKPTRSAYVYVYQQTPSGEVNVLFPIPQIAVRNPVPENLELRIPPEPASFTLNAKDIGTETVHIVASLTPLPTFEAALGQPKIVPAALECTSRGLEFDSGAAMQGCSGSRGLEFDSGGTEAPSAGYSLRAVTTPGDDRIVQSFTFQHVP